MAIRVKTKENGWSFWPAVSHFGYYLFGRGSVICAKAHKASPPAYCPLTPTGFPSAAKSRSDEGN